MEASSNENVKRNKLEQLYNFYESKMYGIAYSILNNVGQAEDAVHAVSYTHLNRIKLK